MRGGDDVEARLFVKASLESVASGKCSHQMVGITQNEFAIAKWCGINRRPAQDVRIFHQLAANDSQIVSARYIGLLADHGRQSMHAVIVSILQTKSGGLGVHKA